VNFKRNLEKSVKIATKTRIFFDKEKTEEKLKNTKLPSAPRFSKWSVFFRIFPPQCFGLSHTCHTPRFVNLLKPTGYVMHHQFNIQQLYALSALYLCVLYLFENKQRLVPLTA
jgi:hypothetical protein